MSSLRQAGAPQTKSALFRLVSWHLIGHKSSCQCSGQSRATYPRLKTVSFRNQRSHSIGTVRLTVSTIDVPVDQRHSFRTPPFSYQIGIGCGVRSQLGRRALRRLTEQSNITGSGLKTVNVNHLPDVLRRPICQLDAITAEAHADMSSVVNSINSVGSGRAGALSIPPMTCYVRGRTQLPLLSKLKTKVRRHIIGRIVYILICNLRGKDSNRACLAIGKISIGIECESCGTATDGRSVCAAGHTRYVKPGALHRLLR